MMKQTTEFPKITMPKIDPTNQKLANVERLLQIVESCYAECLGIVVDQIMTQSEWSPEDSELGKALLRASFRAGVTNAAFAKALHSTIVDKMATTICNAEDAEPGIMKALPQAVFGRWSY
jgi:hypothetical protein